MIALSLSGGGSRAIAFHLGCLRALNDRGVLQKISVVSAVSGGSVIAGLYAYWNDSFEDFHERVLGLLRRGLNRAIARRLLSVKVLPRVVATNLISRPLNTIAKCIGYEPPLRRWGSRADALQEALQDIFGTTNLSQVMRPNLDIVFNACELRTGTAFRFGNHRSGSWRLGEIISKDILVAHAIACSAAYPLFLPAFDREYSFKKEGKIEKKRAVITDGGIYDNLGMACFEPNRDHRYSLHTYSPDFIISCSAGHGQFTGKKIPYGFFSRTQAAFESVFRKSQDGFFNRLHLHKRAGNIKGFILPYLGQQDQSLPFRPFDLIKRHEVIDYPTNFAAMCVEDINRLSLRGEQLTNILLSHYCPDI